MAYVFVQEYLPSLIFWKIGFYNTWFAIIMKILGEIVIQSTPSDPSLTGVSEIDDTLGKTF